MDKGGLEHNFLPGHDGSQQRILVGFKDSYELLGEVDVDEGPGENGLSMMRPVVGIFKLKSIRIELVYKQLRAY